jgi:HK97 family phage portal protein
MGLLSSVHEARSAWIGPMSLKDPALARLFGSGTKTDAGIVVTDEMALMCAAVFQGVNVLSSDIAKAPMNLLKRRPNGGSDHYIESKTYHLLKTEPNAEMGAMVFRQTLTAHALTLGGGYAEIERNALGQPVALWPITPNRICATRDDNGRLFYLVDQRDPYAQEDILHIHGLGFDGTSGYALLHLARQVIGLALATEKYASSFFGNNATIGGVISLEGSKDPEELKDYRAAIEAAHKGSDKAFRLLLLDNGAKFQPYTGTNQDAQMDELRDKQVEEVSRFFRIPVHKLNNLKNATYSNIEHQDLEYYKGPILDWFTLWEQECGRKLIARPERRIQFFKHNANVFLRGDISSRYTALGIARDKGIISANEWRELEDMNPQGGPQGDEYFVQSAQVPARLLADQAEAQTEKIKADAEAARRKPEAMPPNTPSPDPVLKDRAERAEQALAEVRAQLDAEIEKRSNAEGERDALTADVGRQEAAVAEARSKLETVAQERAVAGAMYTDGLAKWTEAQTLLSAAERDLDTARTALAVKTAEVEEARTRESEASTKWHNLSIVEAELRRERDALTATVAETGEQLTVEQRAREAAEATVRELTERVETAEARTAQALSEFNVAKDDAEAAKAEAARLEAVAREAVSGKAEAEAVATEARSVAQAAQERLSVLDREVGEANGTVMSLRSMIATVTVGAEEAKRAASVAEALAADVAAKDAELAEARRLLSERDREVGETRAALAQAKGETDAARQVAEAALVAESRGYVQQDKALAQTIAAHRHLFVHVMRGAIERETDRARRAQQSPEKLRTWIESWYDGHGELMRAALLPAVQIHLAFMGATDDPGEFAAVLVNEHIATSRRQLQTVVNGDAEALAGSLAGLLRRWETERIHEIPDRLMAKEVAYVRK